ncbi:glutathione S-transferase family protein [Candidatus Pelagibacter sp.]|nr:glutathione S-transferase family protein [Candidatus Pelagibacter bacterium]MDC0364059.1 glutathione S-transferase family protein [Candidatus Pelagibacter sp.]
MIELFAADTPNGKKITIMLEELNCDYKLSKINLSKDEQFTADFKKISPFSKIPVIIDHDNKQSLFESGAILIYLGEKFNKFYELKDRTVINQWLMAQMGTIGPMIGQHHQFHHYNPGKSKFGEERYFKITKRIYGELDLRLASSKFLAGNNYTIADIATWPWLARHEWHDIGLKNYKNLTRWYTDIASRDAVIKGYDLLKNGAEIPKP